MTKESALYIQFEKTVKNLYSVLEKYKTAKKDRDVFRDSAIQRFADIVMEKLPDMCVALEKLLWALMK